jgi:ABC-2 type transport system permease protein
MSEAIRLAWHQFHLERRMLWRNPSAAFFNMALPLIFLALFGAVFNDDRDSLEIIVPGIAGMAVMATTFNSLSMNLTFLREQGVLKRIRGSAMPEGAYLTAVLASSVFNAVIQVVLITLAGRIFFDIGWPKDVAALAVFVAAGVACMGSLGIALSHVIPNFESASAYSNAIFLPMILISGTFFDTANTPAFLRDIAQALPLTHLIQGLKGAMITGHGVADNASNLAVVALWAAFGVFFAIRGFSWESRQAG